MANKFNFDKVIANLKRVKSDLPRVLANDTKNFFVGEFNKQQWDGKSWQDVKRHDKSGGSSRNRSAILVQSGRLRRAVINSLKSANFEKISFQVADVDYAQVHNEGLKAGRGKGFTMPKRTFMGQTKVLTGIQLKTITKFIDGIWRG